VPKDIGERVVSDRFLWIVLGLVLLNFLGDVVSKYSSAVLDESLVTAIAQNREAIEIHTSAIRTISRGTTAPYPEPTPPSRGGGLYD
jgi:hypothetical protein